ncbi:MAG TPA: hypothetical protein VG498_16130 [Terriglobales bacterium]|nr:hypothetical protein [Terriglobales bacterium]
MVERVGKRSRLIFEGNADYYASNCAILLNDNENHVNMQPALQQFQSGKLIAPLMRSLDKFVQNPRMFRSLN